MQGLSYVNINASNAASPRHAQVHFYLWYNNILRYNIIRYLSFDRAQKKKIDQSRIKGQRTLDQL